jgi:hypothetical protein
MVLAVGLTTVLYEFGIPVQIFAFADRRAIWQLSSITPAFYAGSDSRAAVGKPNFNDLLRLVSALNQGGRTIPSYPLDAVMTAQGVWEEQQKKRKGAGQTHHVSIVISDFISPQALDMEMDWEEKEGVGQCILINLLSVFNADKLKDEGIPESIYKDGITSHFKSTNKLQAFSLDPETLCQKQTVENGELYRLAEGLVKFLLKRRDTAMFSPSLPPIVCVQCPLPPTDKNSWQDRAREAMNFTTPLEFVTQYLPFAVSPLIAARLLFNQGVTVSGGADDTTDVNEVTEVLINNNIETPQVLLEQRSRGSGHMLCAGVARDIAVKAHMEQFEPNRAAGKEPSASSGVLWIAGLRRFISSAFTYPYLFLKKSRRNEKAYSITVVIDCVCRLFSPINISHTVLPVFYFFLLTIFGFIFIFQSLRYTYINTDRHGGRSARVVRVHSRC